MQAEIMSRMIVYSNQHYHEDTGNAVYQKLAGEAQTLSVQFSQACAWVEPELLALKPEWLAQYFEALPELEDYRRTITQVTRMRSHILDAATEALLAKVEEVAEGPSNIFSMFNNADVRFPDAVGADGKKHPMTIGSYIPYMESSDRSLRKSAFQGLYSTYAQYKNIRFRHVSGQCEAGRLFCEAERIPGCKGSSAGCKCNPGFRI